MRNTARLAQAVAAFGIAVGLSACGSSGSGDANGTGDGTGASSGGAALPTATPPATPAQQVQQILDARTTDYGEAARTAKLKLNDELPDLAEINQIANAADLPAKKVAYEALVDTWIASPKFAITMIKFWQDTFRTGQVGAVAAGMPDLDKAALFAARMTVEGKPYTDLFTASTNTCPTFDPTTSTFTDGNCPANGATAGILTDPGLLSQYFSNMAFRRVRFIQETFACSKFPAEFSKTPVAMGVGNYTNPNDFNAITGKVNTPTAKIDFQDTSAVICANCHGTINFKAPLFIDYDAKGVLQTTSQVDVPVPGTPKAAFSDYLQAGQSLQWRFGKQITDIPTLGAAMAADPDIAKCAVNRAWNYALSRGDIVNDLASVPDATTAPLVTAFTGGGFNLKETIRTVFKTDDFTKF